MIKPTQNPKQQELLKMLPKVDKLLLEFKNENQTILKNIINDTLDEVRETISLNKADIKSISNIPNIIKQKYKALTQNALTKIVNATGIVIQTNLGRSVLDEEMLERISPLLCRYNDLEYDLINGKRGERYTHASKQIIELFGASLSKAQREEYDALLVNNNAAAVMLILNTFAKNKEVIISRGELIEIGGSFRVSSVMESSNAILKEVGSTNKTHIKDYENAINENSTMIVKAHKSNFYMDGFTQEVDFKDITNLCSKHDLIDYFDVGSGYVGGKYGIQNSINDAMTLRESNIKEPSITDILKDMPSIVSFSGDKLFGGSQAGIIIAKKPLIKAIKSNHLLRAFRVDKFSILVTMETLNLYLSNQTDKIPSIKMLKESQDTLKAKATQFLNMIDKLNRADISTSIIEVESKAGGGALPWARFKSFAVGIKSANIIDVEKYLRSKNIIARIKNDILLLDVRTLLKGDMEHICQAFKDML